MSAFLYGVVLRWKLDLQNKEMLLIFYIVPLLLFASMSGIFHAIDPSSTETLMQKMTVFNISIGALLGVPIPLIEQYGSYIKKVYKVSGIPMWVPVVNSFISSFIHLYIVSLIIFFVSPIAFNAKVPNNLFVYFAHLTIFIIVSICIGIALGLMVRTKLKFIIICQFVLLPSLVFSGILFPISILSEKLRNIAKILPATSGFTAMTMNKFDIITIYPMLGYIFALGLIICGITLNKMNKKSTDKY